jgi:hypothetical protein
MKKVLVFLIGLGLIVGAFADVAVAEDRLSLFGSLRVRGWAKDNYDDFDSDDKNDRDRYFDQRFRLGGKIAITDGVTANFRFDIGEGTWGLNYTTGGVNRPDENTELQVDRAFIRIEREYFILNTGQQFMGYGNLIVLDGNNTGVGLRLKLPVRIDLNYAKLDENDARNDEESASQGLDTKDTDLFGIQAAYVADAFTVGAFYATSYDWSDAEVRPGGVGIFANGNIGPVALKGEFDFFHGSLSPDVDAKGLQFWLNGGFALTEAVTLGGNFYYANGYDDIDERQIQDITDFGDFIPHSYGAFETDFSPTPDDIFDFTGNSQGAIGGDIFASFGAMENLVFQGQFGYLKASKSNFYNGSRGKVKPSVWYANLSGDWTFAENTALALGFNYTGPNDMSAADDGAWLVVGRLQVKF